MQRAFDVFLGFALLAPVFAMICVLAVLLCITQGGPVFFVSERIGRDGRPFRLWKFRTMEITEDGGVATGGDKTARITRDGQWMRRYRLDELPQLWNVLRGELSFVGPRPPLRRYVERHAELYGEVLRSRPGLTGLATLVYHRTEARLLSGAATSAETDEIYSRRCVPRKARLDLIHQRHASLILDIVILWKTVFGRRQ